MQARVISLIVVLQLACGLIFADQTANNVRSQVSFETDIMPIFSALGCNDAKCHGSTGSKQGLQLSLFSDNSLADFNAVARDSRARIINLIEPQKSLLLLKPTAEIPHKGGKIIKKDSPQYKTILKWISLGASVSYKGQPELISIKASPEKLYLQKDRTAKVTITAQYSDGTQKDITQQAKIYSNDQHIAMPAQSGTVKGINVGQCAVTAVYMGKHTIIPAKLTQTLPTSFPKVFPYNEIDKHTFAMMKTLGIPPSGVSTDNDFIRRVYLDVIGTLPTPEEVRLFLLDEDQRKRSKLIDKLMVRDEFADFWTLKWGDLLRLKSEYPSNLWPNAVQAYHRSIRDSIAGNKPYDQFVRELLVSSGSDFRDPPVNFYRAFAKRDPQKLSDTTAMVFMGARTSCASCHAHPIEGWTVDDNLKMAAFFSKVGYKKTQEWKEEIVYFNPDGRLLSPGDRKLITPAFIDGSQPKLEKDQDPRIVFADWLITEDNPWFAKNITNRIWYWLLGRGIIDAPDDIRSTNPPSNPQLLNYLAKELIKSDYDLRHIYRLILNSRTYQLSSETNKWNKADRAFFSHYPVKRMTAEQTLDAVEQITGVYDSYSSRVPEPYTVLPKGHRAIELEDGSIGSSFLELFGRPSRDSAFESERNCEISMRQTMHFINSQHLQAKINASPVIKQWIRSKIDNRQIVDRIYLSALSRYPTDEEKSTAIQYLADKKRPRTQAIQDLAWAVLNTKEFMFIH